MTLKEWEARYGERAIPHVHTTACYVPDTIRSFGVRARLWSLSDYRVTSVTGGAIWLLPKPRRSDNG